MYHICLVDKYHTAYILTKLLPSVKCVCCKLITKEMQTLDYAYLQLLLSCHFLKIKHNMRISLFSVLQKYELFIVLEKYKHHKLEKLLCCLFE